MSADMLLEELEMLMKVKSSRSGCRLSFREKVAIVLRSRPFSCSQRPCTTTRSHGMSVREMEDIRRLLCNKLTLRQLRLLIGSLLSTQKENENHSVEKNDSLRLRRKRGDTTKNGHGSKTKPSDPSRCRYLKVDCFSFESIQLGRFFLNVGCPAVSNQLLSKRTNCVRISPKLNSIEYCIASWKQNKRYVSTYSLPFPFINRIYTNRRDVFLRLDSCAMFDSCFCDGAAVNVDVTEGERSNSLFHHIVLRSEARYFCDRLMTANEQYFSKVIQPFVDFSKGLTGLHRMTPNELKVEAKAIVSQNSRTPPPENKARDPFAFGPRRRSSSNRTVCYDQPDPKASKESNDQNVHKSSVHESAPNEVETSQPTLCSEYSLPQIPDATAETPAAKSPEYFAGKSIPQSIDRAMHLGGAYIDDTRGSSITSPSVSEFTKFYSTPRATSVEAESPRIPDALEGDNPQSGGVPSLYTQQEYRSESQDMNGSTPARTVDNFDVPPWPSSAQFHYNDLTQTSLPTINNDFGQSLLSDGDQLLQDYIDTPWWENGANDPLSDLLYDTTTDYFNDFLS